MSKFDKYSANSAVDPTDVLVAKSGAETVTYTVADLIDPQKKRIDHTAPYTVLANDGVLFCDTDGGDVTVNLLAGASSKRLKLVNVGTSGNDILVTPAGSEQVYAGGAGVAFTMVDAEVIEIDFDATEGWW